MKVNGINIERTKSSLHVMRVLSVLIIWVVMSAPVSAQDTVTTSLDTVTNFANPYDENEMYAAPDSSRVQSRNFDQGKLDALRVDKDFDYRQPPTVAESLWDRFLNWLDQLFGWILRGAVATNWGRVLMYALGLIGLVALVMMLLKVDALKVFYSGADKGALNYQTFEENIHEMDFEKLIQDALDKKEYRNGIRLTFLYALKMLSDKQHVDWRPGKTNHDYITELTKQELKTGFNELSFYFDYAWYGDFAVNETTYQRVRGIFDNWRKKVE